MMKNRDCKLAVKLCKEICYSFIEKAQKLYDNRERFSKFYLTQFRDETIIKSELESINTIKENIEHLEENISNYQFDLNSGTITYPDGKKAVTLPGTTEEEVEMYETKECIKKLFEKLDIQTNIFNSILLYTLDKYSNKAFYLMRRHDETNREQGLCVVGEKNPLNIDSFIVDFEKTDKIILDHMKDQLFETNSENSLSVEKDKLIKSTFENMMNFSTIVLSSNEKDLETKHKLEYKISDLLANRLNFNIQVEHNVSGKDDFYYKNSLATINVILGQCLDDYLIHSLEENGQEAFDLKKIKDLVNVNPKVTVILRNIIFTTGFYIDQNLESSEDIYIYLWKNMTSENKANDVSKKTGELDKIRENNRRKVVAALEVLKKYLGIEYEYRYENLDKRNNISQEKNTSQKMNV